MTELICIVCPKGCHLKVDEDKDTGWGKLIQIGRL